MEINFLFIAGVFNFIAAFLHLAIIVGGPSWYRFFGAGEAMATLAESGSIKAAAVTLLIALVLFVWGLLVWSDAGILPSFPMVEYALYAVTAIYLLRGVGGLLAPFFVDHPFILENSVRFWIVSSTICIIFGLTHFIGAMKFI